MLQPCINEAGSGPPLIPEGHTGWSRAVIQKYRVLRALDGTNGIATENACSVLNYWESFACTGGG
jgi:hypothetical protein